MGFKLIMLAAIGLASLYMIHLLAMDYMKIRRFLATAQRISGPAVAAVSTLFRGKRDINTYFLKQDNFAKVHLSEMEQFSKENLKLNWEKISNSDNLNCLSSLICQIVAGAEKNTEEAYNIRNYVEFSYNDAPINIQNAYKKGQKYLEDPNSCFDEYPLCIYSANSMLKILRWFIYFKS